METAQGGYALSSDGENLGLLWKPREGVTRARLKGKGFFEKQL